MREKFYKQSLELLMSSGITDSSLKYHLQNAKEHGVTQKEIAAIIAHVAFYAGWPKGWAELSCSGIYRPDCNVTFEPGCRNNWHIHHAESGADRF